MNQYFLLIRLDENGEINRISYSNQVRDSFMTTLAPEDVKQFYKALLLMDKLLYENVLHYKLNAGKYYEWYSHYTLPGTCNLKLFPFKEIKTFFF